MESNQRAAISVRTTPELRPQRIRIPSRALPESGLPVFVTV